MKTFWSNLNDRERWLLGAGGVFCFFLLFYGLIYSPFMTAREEKSKQLIEKQETLNWMRGVRGQYKTARSQNMLSNTQLLTVLANQLHRTSCQSFSYQLQQTSAGDIQLSYEQVPFNPFVQWLWSFSKKYAISIKQFKADRTDSPGIVKMRVVIAAQ